MKMRQLKGNIRFSLTDLPAVRPDKAAHWAGIIAPVIDGK